MSTLKNSKFWIGFAAGVVIGPAILSKFAPSLKAKIPG